MYAVNPTEYLRWRSVPSAGTRFWLRSWIDSIHMGTHVHWQLSPLSVLALAHLWQFMAQQEPRYTKHQRVSIKAMARRRLTDPGVVGQVPEFGEADAVWDGFFASQVAATDSIRRVLVAWNLQQLKDKYDPSALFMGLSSLYSALLISGFRTDQLFRAVCKGVLDPDGKQLGGPADNLVEFLSRYGTSTPREYLAYTYILPLQTETLSKRLAKKWSNLTLATVDEFNDPRTLPVLLAGNPPKPCIITRRTVVGGIAELHRREAIGVFCLRLQLHPEHSILVFPQRSYYKLVEPDALEKYYDVSFNRTEISIDRIPDDDAGVVLLYKASRDLLDSPEDAIRNLMVAAELRWRRRTVRETDKVLANAFRWALRRRLSGEFADYLSRVRKLGRQREIPVGSSYHKLAMWNWDAEKDFALLLNHIKSSPDFDDQLTLCRLQEIVNWYTNKTVPTSELTGLAHTFREAEDLLSVARGVRNSATHFAEAENTLYGVMVYLARFLVEAFTACLTRDSVNAATSASSSNGLSCARLTTA